MGLVWVCCPVIIPFPAVSHKYVNNSSAFFVAFLFKKEIQMRKFLKKILLYALPIILMAVAMELLVEQIPNSYTYKRQYMEQHATSLHTLILGSSYAYDGIDAALLPHAFNLANSSQCFEDDYRLLAKYLSQMDSLQTVILPLSYSSLQMVSSSNRRGYYTIYMELYSRWPISKYSFECCNLELMAKKIVKYLLNDDMVRCDSLGQRLGHTLASRPDDWQQTQALVSNDRFVGPAAMPYVEENIQWLQQMAELCAGKGVRLFLVAMPVLSGYRQGMPQEQIALMEQVLLDMSAQYDCVQVLDYQRWGCNADFWNATHLNIDGARRLTREIFAEWR